MPTRAFHLAGKMCAVTVFALAFAMASPSPSFAQGTNAKPAQPAQPGQAAPAAPAKPDIYGDARRAIPGPAGNPECVWLGQRVVSLLWRDDIETAFRHLDLYDRFHCPGEHVQAAFRCLILHASSIDPKAPDSLNNRVEACWLNPAQPAPPPAPAAPAAAPPGAAPHR
jgi:hypothetical protein